ncbi:MAG: Fe-S cluster protein [Proteobacteria bacterium]|nr:Fe-S cluster protein [Pseudomonadota bacterium]MBU1583237.1 Fe-S cluster protein [Pseudomonadota bacterium]MBU2455498.1 Fe-S cluster protein [Pseudomonadota bacterium]MBU2630835.1 Fe-S cluster protein [Pseudomonadota bacterium]
MLLSGYTKEIFRSKCMPGARSIHCYAYLNEDVGKVIPYLNTVLGGTSFTREPPSVTFKVQGKLISVHAGKIAVNALKDENEADKILQWLQNQINITWEDRKDIKPSFESAPKPVLTRILKLLPKTNCRECNSPTCMVFAIRVMEGIKDQNDCPGLSVENKEQLQHYLSQFDFDNS